MGRFATTDIGAGLGPVTMVVDMDIMQAESMPRWAWKLLMRLAKLERGQVYRLTVVMDGDEPVWAVEPVGRLENTHG